MSKKPVIVFEGIEGSGKSYHISNVSKYLKKNNIAHIKIREPGGSLNSEKIRKLILDKNSNFAFKSSELGLETTLYFQNSITEILKKIDSLNIDRVLISNLDKFEIPRGNYRVLKDIEVFNFKSLSHSPNKTPR